MNISRREFLGTATAAATQVAIAPDRAAAGVPGATNILFILADQHRFDCLGAMGNPEIKTPHLDRLATDGVMFENAFCTYPICTPSRYSLLSGQYTCQHRGESNLSTLPTSTFTFPKALKGEGYRTRAVGKMHFTPTYLDVGFDHLNLAEQAGSGRWVDEYHRYLKDAGEVDLVDLLDQVQQFRQQAPPEYWTTFGSGASNLSEAHHSTTWIGTKACQAISEWKPGEKNLLMVGFIKPHHPFDPPDPWPELYDDGKLTLLPGWTQQPLERDLNYHPGFFDHRTLSEGSLRRVMRHYYASISHIDEQVGRMLDLLLQKGLYGNTLIVYTSDHGEYMGFHHLLIKGNQMYDPVVKVPLLLKFPKQAWAGAKHRDLVSLVDLTSTFLQEAGASGGPDTRGRPLQDICSGRTRGRDFVVSEFTARGSIMIRSSRHKLIYSHNPKHCLFFDLEKDWLERANLWNEPDYEVAVRAMKDQLLDWFHTEARTGSFVDAEARTVRSPEEVRGGKTIREHLEQRMGQELARLNASPRRSIYGRP